MIYGLMKTGDDIEIHGPKTHRVNRCLSCGTAEKMGKRRYCSVDCRQRLRHQLNVRTGLLRALNTRYATFYFNDRLLIMDVLPSDASQIFSFMFPRSRNGKPAEDFSRMANELGNAWWKEVKRTQRRYLASRHLFDQADHNHERLDAIRPVEIRKPVRIGKSVIHLQLDRSQLDDPQLTQIIKQAYRCQAKKHHPDQGGNPTMFRKIHEAYQQLVAWAENPTFVNRRGFPDKWFYDSSRNRWMQPAPVGGKV
jgi:hypothetical protein